MRIVHIITRLIVGGAQENTLLSCEGQHARGHDVTLITGPGLGPEGSLMDRARQAGYRLEIIDDMRRAVLPLRDWRAYRRMIAILRELKPDIVHTHSSKAGILGRRAAAKAGGSAVIHTIHGLSFTASSSRIVNSAYKFLERRAARHSTRIVCVADAMREQSLSARIGRPTQYVTVYSGMDTGPFLNPPHPREEVRRQLGLNDQHVVVGTIARLFYLKGHDDLLEGAPELCSRFPNLRFLWVGDGLLRAEFEQRIAKMGLTDRFILTGLVPPPRIPELAAAMDILVHPSRREGLARALPQAQLAGHPVVAYDVDGNREGFIHGETGYLVKAFDQRELCRRVAVLIEQEATRSIMGRAGREFALRRFGQETMIDALDAVYRQAIEEIRGAGPAGGEA